MRQLIFRCIPGICLFAAGLVCGWWYTRHTEVATLQLAAASQEVTIATLHKRHAELLERAANNTAKAVLANEQAASTARKIALDAEPKLEKTAKASTQRIAAVRSHPASIPSGRSGAQGKLAAQDAHVLADIDRPGPDSLVAPVRRMRDEAVRAGNSVPDACAVSTGSSFCPY
ncbi:hypothetical protein LJC46_09515 [Desulfovibrio sp. OttesenSCG-928-G15]|nr:hypothetical protein [Desulfovibrio sp. OttesenSCG-928-G15]